MKHNGLLILALSLGVAVVGVGVAFVYYSLSAQPVFKNGLLEADKPPLQVLCWAPPPLCDANLKITCVVNTAGTSVWVEEDRRKCERDI